MYNLIGVILVLCFASFAQGQSASVYRSGALIGSYSTLHAASAAASELGDSIVLSPHTFYEYEVPVVEGQIWQGTISKGDTSTIDALRKGTVTLQSGAYRKRALVVRDIILTNGEIKTKTSYRRGGGSGLAADSVILRGHTILRNCHSDGSAGAIAVCYAFDHVKIMNNVADSFGGAAGHIIATDSVEICYNRSRYGGAIGFEGRGGYFIANSRGVRLHHNVATEGGGAIYGSDVSITGAQIYYNSAPIGAAIYSTFCSTLVVQHCRVYNPYPDGRRQNEFYLNSGSADIEGTWMGSSDTLGLFRINPDGCHATNAILGKHLTANWSLNFNEGIDKSDTLFPVGALFTYSDKSRVSADQMPYLEGNFTCTIGTMLNPRPSLVDTDTLMSLYRTYGTVSTDTGNKPVRFLCSVDADTFDFTENVWGNLTNKGLQSLKGDNKNGNEILMYPNPVHNLLYYRNVPQASILTIFNLQGVQLLRVNIEIDKNALDLSSLEEGGYIVELARPNGQKTKSVLFKM